VQTTLLGFAIALILALVAALVGPYFVHWNDHRAFFETEASRLVGVPVRVGGDIDAALLPFPSVTLRDIAIGPAGDTSRLRARSLRVELGLGPLLRGEIRATEMRLVAPQLNLGLDRQGQIDWPPLSLSGDTLSIDKLSIEDGRAALTDASSQSQLVLDKVWFTGEVRSLTGPLRGRGEFVAGRRVYGYDLSASRGGPEGVRVKLGLKSDDNPLTIDVDGFLALEGATPRFDGAVALARPAGAVLASGKAVAYEPWRLVSKVKAGTASAAFDEVSFQYGPDERAATLAGSGLFEFGREPRLKGLLSARQVDLDRLLATPDTPRRLPLAAVQAFGEMLGNALRPSWPVSISVNIDAMTVGGSLLQNVACDLRSDGADWTLERLELRAPGFTQIKLSGRLYPVGQGLGFAGATTVESNDPKNLAAWIAGRSTAGAQMKPWRATGDVVLGADRIAVERLQTEFGRGPIEGSVAYTWAAANRPARLDANLRAAEFDLDATLGFGVSALSGLGLEAPREIALGLEFDRVRIAMLEARNVTARLTIDQRGVAIERLAISDFGNAGIVASGRISTAGSPGGNIALDLDARDLGGVVALLESYSPLLAEPLRRLSSGQNGAKLQATVNVGDGGDGNTSGKLAVSGRIGDARVKVSASATGKPESFSATNLRALAETDIRLEGGLEADQPATLLALVGLERLPAERRLAKLTLTAQGPPTRDFRFEGTLNAGPIDASGKGALRLPANEPVQINLDQIAGTIGGRKVQGRLAFRFADEVRADGTIESDLIDAPATIAAAIGLPAQRGTSGWPTDPLVLNMSGLAGRIEFKAQRAVFTPAIVVQQLRGVARFGPGDLAFEDVTGDLANGRFEGRLAFANGEGGLSTRARLALRNAEAGALFANAEGPVISGRLSLQTEVEGSGRSPAAFMGSLAGFGTVTLDQGQVTGINPGVFDAMSRAVELGMPTTGNRVHDFVSGVLDSAKVAVPRASATVSINAGQARLSDIVIRSSGADIQAIAGVNLLDATLNASLTLAGPPVTGKPRPSMRIALNGPLMTPHRTVDTSTLMHWLTLLTVDQQARQIDAMEQAARDAAAAQAAKAAEQATKASDQAADQSRASAAIGEVGPATGEAAPAAQAPSLPSPVEVPNSTRPRAAPRVQRAAPRVVDPPGLVGAQP
jgi:uncharacterized protein involved in outer membrane biogenesis